MTKRIFSLLALALLFAACSNIDNTVLDTPTIPTVEGKQNIVEESEFSSYIDWQTYAGDDFYRYATGAWQDRTTLVGDEGSKGIQQEQSALADAYLKNVYKEGTMPQLSRIFQAYRSDDKAKVIRLIQDKLDNIDREVNTKDDAWKKMAALMKDGYCVPMDFTVWPLYRKVYAALLGHSGFGNTGLSDLEVFINDDAERLAMIKIANEYGRIANRDDMPKWGRENCTSDDDDIVLMGDEDDRGLTRSVNFPETTPLGQICKELNITDDEGMAVHKGFQMLNDKLAGATVADLKRLMKYCIIDRDMRYATAESAGEMVEEMLQTPQNPLRILVSRHYAETQVPAENKARVTELSEQCRQAFSERLDKNTWLSSESKAKCKDKLEKMFIFIGWPSSWDENLMVKVPDDAGMTAYEIVCDLYRQRTSKIVPALKGKTDADHILQSIMLECGTYTANAEYNPKNNCVYICASNLIPPIYDPSKSDVYNYAVMGATTVGHEITHGFDTYGAMRDANGRQNSIISGNDQSEFDKRSNDMIAYFGSFTYGDGIPVDGNRTNRENIADQGGLHNAYDALMKRSGGQASERLYKAREYFRAYAYGWLEKGAEGYMEVYLTDVHSPSCIRATGNVFMADEFYEAFGITDGKLYITPKKRIHIW